MCRITHKGRGRLYGICIVRYLIFMIPYNQIDYQVQKWQQRNGPIIHDVTSVKYNKENGIFSHYLICFPGLKKSVKNRNKEHIKLHLFYCKISTLF